MMRGEAHFLQDAVLGTALWRFEMSMVSLQRLHLTVRESEVSSSSSTL